MFFDQELDLDQLTQPKTNLTTDFEKDSENSLKLSLTYKSSMTHDSLCKQLSSTEEYKQSALEGKILQFKKCLSSSSDFDRPANLLRQTSSTSSGAYSTPSVCHDTLRTSNPLTSLDYLASGTPLLGGPAARDSDFLVSKIRKIAPMPFRVLDAPNLCDDFYLNLVDWSQQNALAVALGQTVFIWNANTSSVTQLVDLGERNRVTSVSWSQRGSHLSVGTLDGQVQIWDI